MPFGLDDEGGGLSPAAIMKHSASGRGAKGLSGDGLLTHATSGRTDRIPMDVPTGSYILPADVVSGLGQGNTLAGAKVMDMILTTMPFGSEVPLPRKGGMGIPNPPHAFKGESEFARGGEAKHVPVIVAGGEYKVKPEEVAALGGYPEHIPDYEEALNHGHEILDNFVLHIRDHTVKTTAKLPPPKK